MTAFIIGVNMALVINCIVLSKLMKDVATIIRTLEDHGIYP